MAVSTSSLDSHEWLLCAETCLFDLNLEWLLSGSGHRNLNIECVLGAHRSHSGKGGNSVLDTRVYCCPIPLDFRKESFILLILLK
jgi:hypothetical protein